MGFRFETWPRILWKLDDSAGTGTVYWEGLAELLEVAASGALGAVLGWGYLEMTGYVGRLRVGN